MLVQVAQTTQQLGLNVNAGSDGEASDTHGAPHPSGSKPKSSAEPDGTWNRCIHVEKERR